MTKKAFDASVFRALVGGSSVLDMPGLRVHTKEEALSFLNAYGYDAKDESDVARLWSLHRRAITYIQTQLLKPGEIIPQEVSEAVLIQEIWHLLTWASSEKEEDRVRARWACAVLRVMHVINHLSQDLFSAFSEEIQTQVLKPYQEVITTSGTGEVTLGRPGDGETIRLEKFDIKPFKTSNSSITKLLAKPEEVAFGLLDRMGVRFVTKSVFDVFRVMHWLVEHNVLSYPHLIPDQATNTLYPLDLFFATIKELPSSRNLSGEEIDRRLAAKLSEAGDKAVFRAKYNSFSNRDYRFIKFIGRRLIRAHTATFGRPFSFYYPYEVQIMDLATFERNQKGPASHSEYKGRQKTRARARVFGGEPPSDQPA